MGLLKASRAALDAARCGDLESVAQALAARALAIEAGESPTDAILEIGEQVASLLQELRASLRTEDARLKQLERSFCRSEQGPALDVRG